MLWRIYKLNGVYTDVRGKCKKNKKRMENTRLELIDDIIKFMYNSDNCRLSIPYHLHEFTNKGYSETMVIIVIDMLKNDYKFIYNFDESLSQFLLTNEGKKVAKIGIKKYLKITNRKPKVWISILISVIALLVSAIQPTLTLFDRFTNKEAKNRNYQSEYRKNQTDSIVKQVFSNETFIEILKDSLKHDTEFLNELKLELKRNTTENQAPNP